MVRSFDAFLHWLVGHLFEFSPHLTSISHTSIRSTDPSCTYFNHTTPKNSAYPPFQVIATLSVSPKLVDGLFLDSSLIGSKDETKVKS